jgi:hypothetical protein
MIAAKLRDEAFQAHLAELRGEKVPRDGEMIPASIPMLEGLLESHSDPFEQDEILEAIRFEYVKAGMDRRQVLVQRERVRRAPDSIPLLVGLADALIYEPNLALRAEASEIASKAVELATSKDILVRYALAEQARVACSLDDVATYRRALEGLIGQAGNSREIDISLPNDVIKRVPRGFADQELLDRYLAAAQA